MRTHTRGHTLIETILVLSVAGTAAGMAIPEITQTISHARVNHAASIAAGDVELAVSLAMRQHTPVRLTVDPVALTITVTDRSTGAVLARRPFGSVTDLKLSSCSAWPAQVEVFPNGSVSQAMALTLALPGYHRHVTLSRAGMVRVSP